MPSKPAAAARGGHDSPVGETPKEELRALFFFFYHFISLCLFFLPPDSCGSTNLTRGVWDLFICSWEAF